MMMCCQTDAIVWMTAPTETLSLWLCEQQGSCGQVMGGAVTYKLLNLSLWHRASDHSKILLWAWFIERAAAGQQQP